MLLSHSFPRTISRFNHTYPNTVKFTSLFCKFMRDKALVSTNFVAFLETYFNGILSTIDLTKPLFPINFVLNACFPNITTFYPNTNVLKFLHYKISQAFIILTSLMLLKQILPKEKSPIHIFGPSRIMSHFIKLFYSSTTLKRRLLALYSTTLCQQISFLQLYSGFKELHSFQSSQKLW